jgi:putative SOS response-associated peptidase YedK
MCGRYSLIGIDDLGNRFRIIDPALGFRSHFNIAPGSKNPVIVRHERTGAVMMEWGLVPHWVKDRKAARRIINARAETLAERPSFRGLLKGRRCLVPATGFYEWKKDGARKIPFYIRLRVSPVFAFAGLYDVWHDPQGEGYATYTIITTEPNELMAPIHNRMPVILNRENETRWLSGEVLTRDDLAEILAPYPPGEMDMFPVLPLVNNPATDDERLIQPLKGL